jgi:hypothetical protein
MFRLYGLERHPPSKFNSLELDIVDMDILKGISYLLRGKESGDDSNMKA